MRHRSWIVAVAGGLAATLAPGLVHAQAARAVPPPGAPITPATAPATSPAPPPAVASEAVPGEIVPAPPGETVPATPGETVPTPPPPATPAPTPYAGAAPPLTAPPGASTPTPPVAPGSPAARPPGFDFGGQSMAPLPPPPAALDPATIRRQPWRGRWWMSLRAGITGPIAGHHPSAPSVLSLGAGADVGWRVGNVLGLGMGLSGQIHNRVLVIDYVDGVKASVPHEGRMLYWDALFMRLHLPLKSRFQPYSELGIGLARLAGPQGERNFGPQVRASLGFDGWVSANVTLGFATTYRLNALNKIPNREGWVVGHALQGTFELGLHW